MNRLIHIVVFLAGLAAIAWIGAGYVGVNLLALSMIALIGVFYLIGAWELYRYQKDTVGVRQALNGLNETPENFGEWLSRIPASLRQSVRLRVEGERFSLPGPSLTPYLAGLLVLLGMLGTFLGMVVTLRGTGAALEQASDLQAIRASLAAPVHGLGFAFGTSIAGVATSAMLGLLSALCRRDRQNVGRVLDAAAATVLRPFSQAWQRDETFRLLQQQASMMPAVVESLQTAAQSLDRHAETTGRQLSDAQQAFHAKAETAYTQLGVSIRQSLKTGLEDSTKAAGEVIAPVVSALHGQMDTMPALAERLTALMSAIERQEQEAGQRQLALQESLHQQAESTHARLVETLTQQLQTSAEQSAIAAGEAIRPAAETVMQALAKETKTWQSELSATVQQHLEGVATTLSASTDAVSGIWSRALDEHRQESQTHMLALQSAQSQLAQATEQRASELLSTIAQRLDDVGTTVSRAWDEALQHYADTSKVLAEDNHQALTQAAATFEQQAMKLIETAEQSSVALRSALQAGDEARLQAWSSQAAELGASLHAQWEQAAKTSESRQQQICEALERVATEISTHAAEQSQQTIAEIRELAHATAEAPKAAAEVIGQLRAQISDGIARDNSLLEERGRLLATLDTLLESINHASEQQRTSIDALVTTSSTLLERVGTQFASKVDEEAGKLTHVASQVIGSAVEVASLGESLGTAVQRFSESNASLGSSLKRIEEALEKAGVRSDEQLAYYVAQAREVVDLTLLSQKQILEELQGVATGHRPAEAAQS